MDYFVLLTDQLVGLLLVFHDRVAHLSVLTLQLFAGKVLDDAGPQRIAQNVGGGAQTVSTGKGKTD